MPNPFVLALGMFYTFIHAALVPFQHSYFCNLPFIAYHAIQAVSSIVQMTIQLSVLF